MKDDLKKDSISTLNDLIETSRDGAKGYQTAAEHSKNNELRGLFQKYAAERDGFVRDLQAAVRSLGEDPDKSGSVSAALHRGWIDIKSAVSGSDSHAVLAECERGEDAAVKAYREASKKSLEPKVNALVLRQLSAVQAAHDKIRGLRDSAVYQKT